MRVSGATVLAGLALAGIFVGIPAALLVSEARRTGQSLGEYLERILRPEESIETEPQAAQATAIEFLERLPIGEPVGEVNPWITHADIVDLDGDGLQDVIVCDAKRHHVSWIRQAPAGKYREHLIGSSVRTPAHVTPVDIDRDGDLDLLVATMGVLFPSNDRIGAVVVLENSGEEEFTNRVLVDRVARVTDVEPGDFDGDGDVDLAVGQFGYDDGEIRWMENQGGTGNSRATASSASPGRFTPPSRTSTAMVTWTSWPWCHRSGRKSTSSKTTARPISARTWSTARPMKISAAAASRL